MEGIAVEYMLQFQLILVSIKKSGFHSYISDDNEQDACYPHDIMFHVLK